MLPPLFSTLVAAPLFMASEIKSAASTPEAQVQARELFRAAVAAHKEGKFSDAIDCYRRGLALVDDAKACILLANLLLSAPAPSAIQAMARRAQAAALADRALGLVHTLPTDADKALLYSRHGYFLMLSCGAFRVGEGDGEGGDGDDDEGATEGGASSSSSGGVPEGLTPSGMFKSQSPSHAQDTLKQAVTSLERATELAPKLVLGWRNLALAYRLVGRLADAERALQAAVDNADPAAAGYAELLYRHGKARKRCGDLDGAAKAFLKCLDAEPGHALSRYWLRVMVSGAEGGKEAGASSGAAARPTLSLPVCMDVLAALQKAATPAASSAPSGELVPHTYIKRLFDGYSKTFEDHLVGALNYKTPNALLKLVLARHPAGGVSPKWHKCADLGCGTGLAGLEFRPHVDYLAGVDLSPGMVAEARTRHAGVYDLLDVGDVEGWNRKQLEKITSGGATPAVDGYDLVVAADVLVYIGDLAGVFATTAAVMRPTSAGDRGLPSLLVVSTEAAPDADGGDGGKAWKGEGFTLTATGRCVHQRAYVVGTAAAAGFTLVSVVRQPIRENLGAPVMGDLYIFELP